MSDGDFWARLAAPFAAGEIVWMPGTVTPSGRAQLLAFMNARAVMDRLDEVCGPDGWRDEYAEGPDGGVLCTLWIRTPGGEWIAKQDAAPNTQIEAVKGGISAALKRAAVRWGIGRYLYFLDAEWADVVQQRQRGVEYIYINAKSKNVKGYARIPTLPAWAVPGGSGRPHPPPSPGRPGSPRHRKALPTVADARAAQRSWSGTEGFLRDKAQQAAAWAVAQELGATDASSANELTQRASDGALSWGDCRDQPGEVLAVLRDLRDNGAPVGLGGDT